MYYLLLYYTYFSHRTSQEELREYYSTQPRVPQNITVDEKYLETFMPNQDPALLMNDTLQSLINPRQDSTAEGLYGLLSTQWCINIHAFLMAALFIIALARLVYSHKSCHFH